MLLEELTGFQLAKKFPKFYGTRTFITAVASARHLSLSSASSTQSIPPHPNSWRSILILSSHLRLDLPSGLLSETALNRLLTFHVPNLMSLFHSLGRTEVSVPIWETPSYFLISSVFLHLLLLLAELPLMAESFGLLNDIFPLPSILDAGYPVFNLHLANILFNVILPSVLGSSLWSFG